MWMHKVHRCVQMCDRIYVIQLPQFHLQSWYLLTLNPASVTARSECEHIERAIYRKKKPFRSKFCPILREPVRNAINFPSPCWMNETYREYVERIESMCSERDTIDKLAWYVQNPHLTPNTLTWIILNTCSLHLIMGRSVAATYDHFHQFCIFNSDSIYAHRHATCDKLKYILRCYPWKIFLNFW